MAPKRQHEEEARPTRPKVCIRRHTDRCFHAVEEVVPERLTADGRGQGVRGYIIEGVMIDADDVAEVRTLDEGDGGATCIDPPSPPRDLSS